jgi:hypothetical protein
VEVTLCPLWQPPFMGGAAAWSTLFNEGTATFGGSSTLEVSHPSYLTTREARGVARYPLLPGVGQG